MLPLTITKSTEEFLARIVKTKPTQDELFFIGAFLSDHINWTAGQLYRLLENPPVKRVAVRGLRQEIYELNWLREKLLDLRSAIQVKDLRSPELIRQLKPRRRKRRR